MTTLPRCGSIGDPEGGLMGAKKLRRRLSVLLALGLLAGAVANTPAGAAIDLPDGFSVATIASGFDTPTSVAFGADGAIFITEKRGRVYRLDGPDDNTPSLVVNIQEKVHNNSDRGLIGLAADPFDSNLIYLSYALDRLPSGGPIPAYGDANGSYDPCPNSATTGCPALSRVSRINVDNGAETVLFEGHCQQFPFHSVGDVLFDNSGHLVVTFGDGSTGSFVEYGQRDNLCGDPGGPVGTDLTSPTTEGGQARSQDILTRDDPTGVHGSVLRVNRNSFAPVADNPMAADLELNAARMIATGFRNPFRATVDPTTGRYYVANVGGAGHEEIQAFFPDTLTNSGWPCYEGPGISQNSFWSTIDLCDQLVASGDHEAPLFSYLRNTPIVAGEACSNGGLSISGLAINRSGFGTPGMNGALFFTDFTRGCIWYLPSNGQGGVTTTPRVFATDVGGLVDLAFGPDGGLYGIDIIGEQLIRFTSAAGQQPPVAALSVLPIGGAAARTVSLDASASFDPNPGDTLSYAWDVDDNGTTDRTGETASYTYPNEGTFTVRLTVTDNTGRSSTATSIIVFGGEPIAEITEPSDGRTFRVGAIVPVRVAITTADGQPLPNSAASWELVLHHCIPGGGCHTHGLEAVDRANGTFVMPDHEYPSNVELILTVTDPNGGTTVKETQAIYRTVDVDVRSTPIGAPVLVGSTAENTPFTREVAVGATTSVSVVDPLMFNGQTFGFDRWRLNGVVAGGSPALELAPLSDVTLNADFIGGGGNDTERPSTPRGLRSAADPNGIGLSWTASTDNVGVTGYQVYRSTNGALGSLFATVPPGTEWVDTSTVDGTAYTYALRAIDGAGNVSWRTNLVTRTADGGDALDTERPSSPRGLRTTVQPWGIELSWGASTDNVAVTNYVIYRSTDGTLGEPWRTVAGGVLSFGNGDVINGVTYTYAIRARDAAGNLSWRSNLSSQLAGG